MSKMTRSEFLKAWRDCALDNSLDPALYAHIHIADALERAGVLEPDPPKERERIVRFRKLTTTGELIELREVRPGDKTAEEIREILDVFFTEHHFAAKPFLLSAFGLDLR